MDLKTLNHLPRRDFLDTLKNIWPDGTWIAEAVEGERPFKSIRGLHQAMAEHVRNASDRRKLALLQAFYTAEIETLLQTRLQAVSGESDEVEALHFAFQAYEKHFGFPYFAALDTNDALQSPQELSARLEHDVDEERMFALRSVSERARQKLEELLA
ncbi:MAG: 2-oxo-4-hydroxy-4-carboxy-5-ureidoimidazoline decarboxylase [Pseudomonadota bacterium]